MVTSCSECFWLGVSYEILVAVLVAIVLAIGAWFFGLIPSLPAQINPRKRFRLKMKIKQMVSKMSLSLQLKNSATKEQIRERFSSIITTSEFLDIELGRFPLEFTSKNTGTHYKVEVNEDIETSNKFLNLSANRPFDISIFGKIKKLQETIEEISEFTDNIRDLSKNKENITTIITVFTKKKDSFKNNNLSLESKENNSEITVQQKTIKIMNKGRSNLMENIQNAFYSWLEIML